MIERKQHDEQHQAKAKADADQLLLQGQQGLDVAAPFSDRIGSSQLLKTTQTFTKDLWGNFEAVVTMKVTLPLPRKKEARRSGPLRIIGLLLQATGARPR
jgi:hypothetical protein